MLMAYASVGAFFLVAIGFILGSMLAGSLLRPNKPSVGKNMTYECGEAPIGQAWFNFNPRFYIIALIYIVFDVEIAFIYPIATVFKRWVAAGQGATAFFEVLTFVAILLLGLVYVWVEGDLEWIRTIRTAGATPMAGTSATQPVPPEAAPPAADRHAA